MEKYRFQMYVSFKTSSKLSKAQAEQLAMQIVNDTLTESELIEQGIKDIKFNIERV
jgi:hypothetical protein